jgi:nucleotide-binding universal stress UspA family protein
VTVQRILVAIDTSPGSLAAAEAAARLAARLQAELAGLFVEDIRLLRLVEAPLAREVDSLTAGHRQPRGEILQRQFRLQGDRAREKLRRIATRHGIPWSFRVARGAVSSEIAAAAREAVIVSLGHGGWSTRPQRTLGAAASAVLEQGSACTLLMRRAAEVLPPVLLVYDGSPEGDRALALARQLADHEENAVRVLLLGHDEKALRTRLTEQTTEGAGLSIIDAVENPAEPRLGLVLRQAGAGSIVVPVSGDPTYREILHEILDASTCPLLLVS